MKRFIALWGTAFIFAGCAHAPIASSPETFQASEGRALVVSHDPSLRITQVDGEKPRVSWGFFSMGLRGRWN